MNKDIKLNGRKQFEESLAFGKKYIVHRSEHNHRLHCYMEGHIWLFKHYGESPRMFFAATQGSSGKTTCLYKSSFFLPVMFPEEPLVTDCGAGYIRELNSYVEDDTLAFPAVLYEESQEALKDSSSIGYRLLNTYRMGAKRIIHESGDSNLKQRLFFPVMQDGLINKYRIPPNYLERCIIIDMPKRRPTISSEAVDELEYFDLLQEIGDSFRKPRLEWANRITIDDIRQSRQTVKDDLTAIGIHMRERQLIRPLMEYAYLIDDYDAALEAARYYANRPEISKKLEDDERLLKDIYEICSASVKEFMGSRDLCEKLNALPDSPWPIYGKKGNGINPTNVSDMLQPHGIGPEHSEDKSVRGYYFKNFIEVWDRKLNLACPVHLGRFVQAGRLGRDTETHPYTDKILENILNS